MFKTIKRNSFRASVLALSIAALPVTVEAAGLGKLTVLSPLGQPLRAELDITASREELSSLSARLASPDAFKQAGIEYVPAMAGVRFVLDKRANGMPFLRVMTDRPVNEPFLDLLIELNWASGKLVREYTFLLDPPEVVQRAMAPVAAPEVKPPAAPVTKAPEAPLAPAVKAVEEVRPATAGKPAAGAAAGRTVVRGDTLAKIAAEAKPEGVNLDQMLVALFRSNQNAFDAGNMNRLRTGKILSIPERDAVAAVEPAEARKIIIAQAADFNAYRKKLAAAAAAQPAAEEAPKQAAAGKITPKVEEKAPAAAAKDQLAVSRTEIAKEDKAGKALQGRIVSLEEDLVARDRALKEAGSRIAELEKNLGDLKKLAELKSQAGAQMQQQAQAAKPAAEARKPEPAPAPAPAAEVKKPEAVEKPVETAKAPEPAAEKPAEKPVEAPKPPVAKKPVMPPPPPPEPPSFIEENLMLVAGGGGVIALLLGYLGYTAWRRKRQGGEATTTTSRITEGDLTANSVFGSTGGQAVDTGASIQTDFSQASLTSIDTDEGVDPVAEADVYMAYGRDAQAEEILIDALKNDPTRYAIHLKLLEIYAGRKSAKQFETLATDLYGQTGGTGPDWEKAAALGRSLSPDNPLYGGKAEAPAAEEPPVPDLVATTIIVPPTEAEKLHDTVTMPGELGRLAAAAEAQAPVPEPEPEQPMALDFDLDLGAPAAAEPVEAAPAAPVAAPTTLDFDLDLGLPAAEEPAAPAATAEAAHLDLDLSLPELEAAPVEPAPAPASAVESAGGLDFEFELDTGATPVAAEPAEPAFDLTSIDLDLGAPIEAPAETPVVAPLESPMAAAEGGDGEDNPDVATKLELAQAYEEMGDKEGARELLQEVINEGSVRQQAAARGRLAQLDA